MKKLYLLRHACALPMNINNEEIAINDIERIVSPEGRNEITELCKVLPRDFSCDIVLCSTAVRTQQTWHALRLKNAYDFPVQDLEKLYNPSLNDMVEIIKKIKNNYNSACIVSHNPTIGELATYLTSNEALFDTCTMKSFELKIKSWNSIRPECAKIDWSLPE